MEQAGAGKVGGPVRLSGYQPAVCVWALRKTTLIMVVRISHVLLFFPGPQILSALLEAVPGLC